VINRRQFRGCGVAAAVCVALTFASLVHADTGLAFEADFEAPVFTPGILVSDPDWSFDSDLIDVEVIDTDAASGSQSLRLGGISAFTFNADDVANGSVRWVDFFLKPVYAEIGGLPVEILSTQSAITGFLKVAAEGEVYAINGDGLSGGEWVPSGSRAALNGDVATEWIRLTYRLDYGTKQWDMFVDSQMALTDLGFFDDSADRLAEFTLRADEGNAAGFDYFYAGDENPLYADTANDGLPDDWLSQQGLSIFANQRYGDGDLDGLNNLLEYQLATLANVADSDGDGVNDGAEYFSGANPSTADDYVLSSLPFVEDFESYSNGILGSSNNWEVFGERVAVQSENVRSGLLALEVGADSSASNLINGSQQRVVWVDLYVQPTPAVEAPDLDQDISVAYYFDAEGRPIVFDGLGGGSGFWRLLDAAKSNDWRRVTVKADYAAQAFDFYVDGERLGAGLGFAHAQPYLSRFEVSEPTLLDDLSISTGEPADLDDDRDGSTNAAEIAAGTNPQAFDSDGDGLSDALEALWGLDPNVADTELAQPTEVESGVYTWTTTFSDTEGYVAGALSGQNDWVANGTANVTAAESAELEVSLTTDAVIERLAGIGEIRRVWISFTAKLVSGELPAMENLAEPAVAIWGASATDSLAIWNDVASDWETFNAETDTSEWNEYAIYLDYVDQLWTLCVNGVILADNLPFKDRDLKVFSRFKALQSKVEDGNADGDRASAELDDITFSNTEPAGMDFDGDGLINSIERQIGSDLLSGDSDSDGMPDSWEYDNSLDFLVGDNASDPDLDGLSNLDEFQFGFDPNVSDIEGAPGYASLEVWTGISGSSVVNLTNNARFSLKPTTRSLLTSLTSGYSSAANYGRRIRGTMTAPVTGDYVFWIASDDQSEFWLSADETPFLKERLAFVSAATNFQQWYKYSSQRSQAVRLVAGQQYYFEVLHKVGIGKDHVSVAWQYPGQRREVVPGDYLTTAISYTNDQDLDGLPDDWEVSVGLDPTKGYRANGYAGDFDGDGLLNYEERQLGTNPMLVDTDGDGFSDPEELYELFSDPTVDDLDSEPVLVGTVKGAAFRSARGSWGTEGTELYSVDSAGSISYTLNFTEAGAYCLVVELTEQNAYKSGASTFELRGSLDNHSYGVHSATVAHGETAELHYYLPYLPAGDHDFELDWLNGFRNSFLRIRSVRIERIDGPDADQNGIADWIERRANQLGSETELPLAIYASPFCFEGTSFAPSSVVMDTYPVSDATALREETVQQALYNSYYSNVALTADEDRVVLINDQSGLRSNQVTLTWAAFNAQEHDFIHIRVDDSLLLTAIDPSLPVARPIELELTAPGGNVEIYSLAAEARLQALFDQAGDWHLQATLLPIADEDPIVYECVIRVSSASLDPQPIVFVKKARAWTPSISDGEVVVESDAGLSLYESNPAATPRTFQLNGQIADGRILARLPDGGAIIDVVEPRIIRDSSRQQTYNQAIETFADGTVMVSGYIYLSEVPDDMTIILNTWRSGLTLDDGTNYRTITAEDFDEQGRYRYYMLRAPGLKGGNCFRYRIKQDGVTIGGW
jgi:hypothetical protein